MFTSQVYEQNVCFETVELRVAKRNDEREEVLQSDSLYDDGDVRITEIRTIGDKISRITKQQIDSSSTNIFQRSNQKFKSPYLAIFINVVLMIFSITTNFCKQRIHAPLACASSNGSFLSCFFAAQQKKHEDLTASLPESNPPETEIPDWIKPNDSFIALLEHNSFPFVQASNNTSVAGKIADTKLTFSIDTGANVTAIRADVWRRIPALAKNIHPHLQQ